MGFYQRCFPYYLRKRFLPDLKNGTPVEHVVLRYICSSCNKRYTERIPDLSPDSLEGIPLQRTCSYCGKTLEIENLFLDRRKDR